MLQETGRCSSAGLTLRDCMEIAADLGIDPVAVMLWQSSLVVVKP